MHDQGTSQLTCDSDRELADYLAEIYRNTDQELAECLVERNGLTRLETATEYGEQSHEWIRRDAAGHVARQSLDDVGRLGCSLLIERGQPLSRLADVIDGARFVAGQWVDVRRREFGEPWPGDFDDDPVADAVAAAAYVAERGDLSLPFTWPHVVTSGDGHDICTADVVATDDRHSAPVIDDAAGRKELATEDDQCLTPVVAAPDTVAMAEPRSMAEIIIESRRLGWWPLPVHDKTIPINDHTGRYTLTDEDVAGWAREWPGGGYYDCFAYRHQGTMAIDCDVYTKGGVVKKGDIELRQFAAENNLPPLPPTVSSTKRGAASTSRQYVYRLPAGYDEDRLGSDLGRGYDAVEICRKGLRFTICWPTEWPAGSGKQYRWYDAGSVTAKIVPEWGAVRPGLPPPVSEIAVLPIEWAEALSTGKRAAIDPNAIVLPTSELLDTFDDGEPDGDVLRELDWAADSANHIGHEAYKTKLMCALRYGRDGRPGAGLLVDELYRRHVEYLSGQRDRSVDEADGLLSWATNQVQREVKAPTLLELTSRSDQHRDLHPMQDIPDPADITDERNWSSLAEMQTWLKQCRGSSRQAAFVHRRRWLLQDNPDQVVGHAVDMVAATLRQEYPAKGVFAAVLAAVRAVGEEDNVAIEVMRYALGISKLNYRRA